MRPLILVPILSILAGSLACPLGASAQATAAISRPGLTSPAPTASVTPSPAAATDGPAPSRKVGAASLAVGTWTGPLAIAGNKYNVALAITQQGGTYGGTLDIPGGTVRQRRLQVSVRADTLRLTESTLDVRFTCAVSPDGQLLSGSCKWAQLGSPTALAFHRGTAPEPTSKTGRVSRVAYETKWENGTLENDRPVGIWNYYQKDAAGDYVLVRSYDHTARALTFARPESGAFDAEVSPGVWERTILSQCPWFIGRHDALTNLGSQLTYPTVARQRHIQGKVWVTFAVDTLGRVSDHRILKGLGNGCDEEALRVARTIPDTWTPGRLGTKAVASRQTIMFAFKLD